VSIVEQLKLRDTNGRVFQEDVKGLIETIGFGCVVLVI